MSREALRCAACSGVKHGRVHGQPRPAPPPRSPWVLAGPAHSAIAVSVLRTGHSEVGAGQELASRTRRKSPMLWVPQDSDASCGSACPWSSEVPLGTLGPGLGQKWREGVERRLPPQEERPLQTSGTWGATGRGSRKAGRFSLLGTVSFFPFLFF